MIEQGQRIAVRSTADPDRTFKLLVSELDPVGRMVWENGGKAFHGSRVFVVEGREDGTTDFTMAEIHKGWFQPAVEKKLGDFRPSLEAFAADLKRRAEASGGSEAEPRQF